MSRRRGTQHLKTPPGGRGHDLAKLQRERLMDSIGAFAESMSAGTGIPMQTCTEYALMLLTSTEFQRQCAACLALHDNYTALSWFHQRETRTSVLWCVCEDCSGDEALTAEAQANVEAWIDGSLEPAGLVAIFSPPKEQEPEDDSEDLSD